MHRGFEWTKAAPWLFSLFVNHKKDMFVNFIMHVTITAVIALLKRITYNYQFIKILIVSDNYA